MFDNDGAVEEVDGTVAALGGFPPFFFVMGWCVGDLEVGRAVAGAMRSLCTTHSAASERRGCLEIVRPLFRYGLFEKQRPPMLRRWCVSDDDDAHRIRSPTVTKLFTRTPHPYRSEVDTDRCVGRQEGHTETHRKRDEGGAIRKLQL